MASPPSESPTDHHTGDEPRPGDPRGDARESAAPSDDRGVDQLASDASPGEGGDAGPGEVGDPPVEGDTRPEGDPSIGADAGADRPGADVDAEAGADRPGAATRRIVDDWDTDSDVPVVEWDQVAVDAPMGMERGGLPEDVDDGEDAWDAADWDGRDLGPDAPDEPPAVQLRARRRVWRRRRRVLGTFAFLAVVLVLGTLVARATGIVDGGGDADGASRTTTTEASTTTTLAPAGPYRVLDGLNARSGPGATFPAVGTIRIGQTVMVVCVADGDLVTGPTGQSTKWLKVQTPFGDVFVTAAYVAVGADLADPATIAPCAS